MSEPVRVPARASQQAERAMSLIESVGGTTVPEVRHCSTCNDARPMHRRRVE